MEPWTLVIVLVVALAASVLTFFSGFGLGTLLLPAFALVFPLDVAVAATAVVHLANNAWKAVLVGRWAQWRTVAAFGIPAVAGAFLGAGLLLLLDQGPIWAYDLAGTRHVTPIGLVVGSLITVFAVFDLVPALRRLAVDRRYLVPGGAVSGFFGGLSGHQGALRSVFLTKLGLEPRAFVATGTLCAVLVDVGRLAVYSTDYVRNAGEIAEASGWIPLAGAVAMAILGAILGARMLPKATVQGIRVTVGALLLVLGPLIVAGVV